MSIDLLHRINASERRFRRGDPIIREGEVDPDLDEERDMEIRKRGGRQVTGYYNELIEQLKEP